MQTEELYAPKNKRKRRKRHRSMRLVPLLLIALILASCGLMVMRDRGRFADYVHLNSESAYRTLKSTGDYDCGPDCEGLRVRYVMRALDLGDGIGMNGARYTDSVAQAVVQFQEENGLEPTGTVDLDTWCKMGYTQEQWQDCGVYHSPAQVSANSSRADRIEAMISCAEDYLGDPYVIGASGAPGADNGGDCSGLVMQVLYAAGVEMTNITPETHALPGHEYESRRIWETGQFKKLDYSEQERGDLIFYQGEDGTIIHVAIYLGGDEVIEAWPNCVQVSNALDARHDNVKGIMRPFI